MSALIGEQFSALCEACNINPGKKPGLFSPGKKPWEQLELAKAYVSHLEQTDTLVQAALDKPIGQLSPQELVLRRISDDELDASITVIQSIIPALRREPGHEAKQTRTSLEKKLKHLEQRYANLCTTGTGTMSRETQINSGGVKRTRIRG